MAKFSQKVMGKEVGSASVYAAPHDMNGKTSKSVETGMAPMEAGVYANTKAAKDVDLKDPVPNGVSYGMAREKTDGVTMRGYGAATKGIKSRGPMA
jgi:hypothetical protein